MGQRGSADSWALAPESQMRSEAASSLGRAPQPLPLPEPVRGAARGWPAATAAGRRGCANYELMLSVGNGARLQALRPPLPRAVARRQY